MSKPSEAKSVLIVEDDPEMCVLMQMVFEREGFSVLTEQTGKGALLRFEDSPPAIVILDLKLPDMFGIDVLERMKRQEPDIPVLMLTGYGEIETAVDAIKKGAYHFLSKPYQNTELMLLVRKAIAESRRERDIEALRQHLSRSMQTRYALGKSPNIRDALKALDRVAPTDMTVILQGESGVGKEVMARVLHHKSPRADKPFIALDCGALPEGLVESELFGHERGAFTGADSRRLGQFEIAHGGTLFLDEIANLSTAVQAKLLRVLQERRIQHLGGKREIAVDVRIIAASNRNLSEEVRAGRFREDLYHRLNEFTILIPPLRERPEDITELSEIFLDDARRSLRKNIRGITPAAMELLTSSSWPGNIRQLKNTIRAGALMAEDLIEPYHLLPLLAQGGRRDFPPQPSRNSSLKEASADAEKARILEALDQSGMNKSEAARLLSIDRTVLYDKMKRLGINL